MGDNEAPSFGGESIDGLVANLLSMDEQGGGDVAEQAEAPARKPSRNASKAVADDDTPDDDEQDPDDGTPALAEEDGTAQDDDDQAGESDDAEADADQDADPVFTVEIDGKDAEIPASELIRGYQRQSDYTRKTQELAEYRKGLDAEHQRLGQTLESASQAATKRGEQFDALFGALQDLIKEPDYDAIARAYQDPDKGEAAAFRAKRNYDAAMKRLNETVKQREKLAAEAKADADKVAKEQAEKAGAEAQRQATESRKQVFDVIPEWRDRKRLEAEVSEIVDLWAAEGGDPKVLDGITDPKVWKVLRGNLLYSKAKQARSAAKSGNGPATTVKKVVKPLKVQRPGATGSEERKRSVTREQVARRNKALSAGTVDAALAAVMNGDLSI